MIFGGGGNNRLGGAATINVTFFEVVLVAASVNEKK